ncbi:MAG: glycine cleavage system protein GcvH [Spirochaetota bacterium]|nr:glycine cleavage system protein GcvH [Spirochaetota bacterium]
MNQERLYSQTHEWVSQTNNVATIGLTDFAQKELGDLVFLEANYKVGDDINAKDSVCTIESVKAVSEIYCPVSGKITEINEAVINKPELINSGPYDDGWILKIELSDPGELDELMDETAYEKHIAEQG